MDFLYFLVKGSGTYQPDQDPIGFLKNYFETNGAFTSAFVIALIVALVGLFIFYGIFGMKVFKLAKRSVYWIMFAVVGVSTFALTQTMVVGSKAGQSGFFGSTQAKFEEYVLPLGDQEQQDALLQREEVENKMDGFCPAVSMLDLSNTCVSLLLYFGLSFGVKRFTTYAKIIPW